MARAGAILIGKMPQLGVILAASDEGRGSRKFATYGGHEYRPAQVTVWIPASSEDDGSWDGSAGAPCESGVRFLATPQ